MYKTLREYALMKSSFYQLRRVKIAHLLKDVRCLTTIVN